MYVYYNLLIKLKQIQIRWSCIFQDPAYVSYLQQHGFQLDDASMAIIQAHQYQEQALLTYQQDTAVMQIQGQIQGEIGVKCLYFALWTLFRILSSHTVDTAILLLRKHILRLLKNYRRWQFCLKYIIVLLFGLV